MKKKYVIIGVAAIIVLLGAFVSMYFYTRSFSPRGLAEFKDDGLEISVSYGRPYKKGRTIFGGLEPYGKVWRTGANEPTTFETNRDLLVKGSPLKAGKYSLWTIPNANEWTIILNSQVPFWGVDFSGAASHDAKKDVLAVRVPSLQHEKEMEQFTISIHKTGGELELILLWDKTLVAVPIAVSAQ
jgi:hypothetical protein